MRKIILFILLITLLLTGCNKNQESVKQTQLIMSEGQVLAKNHYVRSSDNIKIAFKTTDNKYYIGEYNLSYGEDELFKSLNINDKVNVYHDDDGNIKGVSKKENKI